MLEKIEIRNWVETQRVGIGYKNSDMSHPEDTTVYPLIFNSAQTSMQDGTVTDGIFITSFTGLGHNPIRYITSKSPNQDGVSVTDFRLEPREINLSVLVNGCDRASYWAIRRALMDAVRPNWVRSSVGGLLTGNGDIANAFGMGTPDRGPHQLVVHVPLVDGTTVERAIDVVFQDGLSFEGEKNDEWEAFSVEDNIGLIAHDGFFYDPVHTNVSIPTSPGWVEFEYDGSWHAYPLILIEMNNASISSSPGTISGIEVYLADASYNEIRILFDASAYGSSSGESTSIAIDLRPNAKRIYIVDDTTTYYDIMEDITWAQVLTKEFADQPSGLLSFYIGPEEAQNAYPSGSAERNSLIIGINTTTVSGADTGLPWLSANILYHTTYIGI